MNALQTVAQRHVDIDVLDQSIVNLCSRINAANYELLVLVREFDERAGWLKWGLHNCTQWLHWRCDISVSAAREKIRVAHALKALAETSRAFATGLLSYSKVRALTRVATPANEASLLDFAMTTTASRVEERCRQLRNVQPSAEGQANRVHKNRSLSVWRNAERGSMTITVEVPIVDGEVINQALSKALEMESSNGAEFESESFAAQQADALVNMAKTYLHGQSESRSSSADAYQVVLHVDESALTKGEGRSDVPLETVKRLTCDGSKVTMVSDAAGEPLNVGRKQRTVSAAMKRALWARDGGCRFPGCTHTRFVDAHHVVHWANGGETSLENLLLFCTQHHRMFHEEGYEIRKNIEGRWYFLRPDGRAIPDVGFLPEDVVDDDISIGRLDAYPKPSAEGPDRDCREAGRNAIGEADDYPNTSAVGPETDRMKKRHDAVRETAAGYWLAAMAPNLRVADGRR